MKGGRPAMWSPLDTERLRARVSSQFRIVGLSYVGGCGVAAVCLVAVVLFTPAGDAVREVLTLPRAALVREDAPLSEAAVDVPVADVVELVAPQRSTAVAVDEALTEPVTPEP